MPRFWIAEYAALVCAADALPFEPLHVHGETEGVGASVSIVVSNLTVDDQPGAVIDTETS